MNDTQLWLGIAVVAPSSLTAPIPTLTPMLGAQFEAIDTFAHGVFMANLYLVSKR
jgi:hypothetical protein